jgi:hypothetical protein
MICSRCGAESDDKAVLCDPVLINGDKISN